MEISINNITYLQSVCEILDINEISDLCSKPTIITEHIERYQFLSKISFEEIELLYECKVGVTINIEEFLIRNGRDYHFLTSVQLEDIMESKIINELFNIIDEEYILGRKNVSKDILGI